MITDRWKEKQTFLLKTNFNFYLYLDSIQRALGPLERNLLKLFSRSETSRALKISKSHSDIIFDRENIAAILEIDKLGIWGLGDLGNFLKFFLLSSKCRPNGPLLASIG